jgi:hypothetical protein
MSLHSLTTPSLVSPSTALVIDEKSPVPKGYSILPAQGQGYEFNLTRISSLLVTAWGLCLHGKAASAASPKFLDVVVVLAAVLQAVREGRVYRATRSGQVPELVVLFPRANRKDNAFQAELAIADRLASDVRNWWTLAGVKGTKLVQKHLAPLEVQIATARVLDQKFIVDALSRFLFTVCGCEGLDGPSIIRATATHCVPGCLDTTYTATEFRSILHGTHETIVSPLFVTHPHLAEFIELGFGTQAGTGITELSIPKRKINTWTDEARILAAAKAADSYPPIADPLRLLLLLAHTDRDGSLSPLTRAAITRARTLDIPDEYLADKEGNRHARIKLSYLSETYNAASTIAVNAAASKEGDVSCDIKEHNKKVLKRRYEMMASDVAAVAVVCGIDVVDVQEAVNEAISDAMKKQRLSLSAASSSSSSSSAD